MADKVKIGTMWLGGCSGCHLSIADFHESLIDVMEFADFEFSPVLMDTKYDEVPELDIIIVEGGIRNDENRELAEMLNKKLKWSLLMVPAHVMEVSLGLETYGLLKN